MQSKWNSTKRDYPAGLCLPRLFEARAARTPEAVAVRFADGQLTYAALNARANQLAHYLRRLGVGPEVPVALCLERSLEMVIAIYGILKAGGAYVPLEPGYPEERLAFMLADCQAPVLLTRAALAARLPGRQTRVVGLDSDWPAIAGESSDNPALEVRPDHLIYVIYTSGSTGRPKGCLNTHGALYNRIMWMQDEYGLTAADRVLQKTPFSFDVSAWEFFWPLIAGAELVVAKPGGHTDPAYLIDLIEARQITTVHFVPSMLAVFLEEEGVGRCRSLQRVFCSGEALSPALKRHFFASPLTAALYNLYGPTEAAIDVTHWTCRRQDRYDFVPLGRPVANTRIYILDEDLKPVAPGVAGELHIGGVQVARGYLNRPELTAAKFIPDPFSEVTGARLYKTGDLARYHPAGVIEYLGRLDDQVKIRGFRIELGEIMAVLDRHPDVLKSVVVVFGKDIGEKRLAAYVVGRSRTPSITELRTWLRQQLPDYMLPAVFLFLERMPLTANGKIDRQALPDPDRARPARQASFVAPATPAEKMLAEIWSAVLKVQPVGVHDNFFELGGDSIRAIQMLALARQQGGHFSLEQLFQNQTIYHLSRQLAAKNETTFTSGHIRPFALLSEQDRRRLPADLEDAYPATQLQTGMLFHSELQPGSAIYHDVFTYRLNAPFEQASLEKAIAQLAARHQALRTSFELAGFTEPLQLVHRQVRIPLAVEDLSHLGPAVQDAAILAWIETEKKRPFDYSRAPLIRFHAHILGERAFHLSHGDHHAILDGWSLAVLFAELLQIYQYLMHPEGPPPIFPDAVPYSHFVALEKIALQSEQCRQYWVGKLQDHRVSKLPRWQNKPRLGAKGKLAVHYLPLSPEIAAGLDRLANLTGVSVKNVFLAAHVRVLGFLSGQTDILTGLVTNGRPEEIGTERTLGVFLNTPPFRLQLAGGSWRQLVRQVFEAERELLPYRRYPLAAIQEAAGGHRLFEAPFVMVHFHILQEAGTNGIEFSQGPFFEFTNFPFFVFFVIDPLTGRTHLRFHLDAGEFCREQIAELAGYYQKTLAAMVADPEERYESFSPLSAIERHRILAEWNDTHLDFPAVGIPELFEAQVRRSPGAAAVVFADMTLSYGELNFRANQLANYLRKLGVGPGERVALCVERSLEMVIGILGILKAGGAYVPLDPVYPEERLSFMVRETQAQVLLTQEKLTEVCRGFEARLYCLDRDWSEISLESGENVAGAAGADQPAYVMYTSGSTGRPKGIEVPHRAIVRLVCGQDYVIFNQAQRFLLLASIAFDASTFELWGALLHGGRCVIYPERHPSISKLGQIIARHGVTTLWLTAALFNAIIDEAPEILAPLQQLVTGGEPLSVAHVRRARQKLPHIRLVNGYGPTESTTFACCYPVADDFQEEAASVPIGRPINNTKIYILDRNRQPVPVGVPGELHIGGAGLASGYLNRPDLTAEKFIPDPFSIKAGERLYKTGDLGRYRPDGNIEFLGRLDQQVKIRGFRVEPGEIETILAGHPQIGECVVVARQNQAGDQGLVGYLVPAGGEALSMQNIRRFLEKRLPDYMIPAHFAVLDALPLTPNGKVDRNVLPEPGKIFPAPEKFQAPRNEIEEALAIIWAQILNVEEIGINDNFFELGGHSLSAARLVSRFRDLVGLEIPLAVIFDCPTVREQADYIKTLGAC